MDQDCSYYGRRAAEEAEAAARARHPAARAAHHVLAERYRARSREAASGLALDQD